ncbi:Chitinase B precursor [Posidoniimonas polymericola]|uniref:chitinase n=1 Tax=Posidoniimonas polymericola TaxID=2528002 RepID=A0A5C5XU37_9BACT|nr:glycoside hydrolase family 18 protein [Posidoniimonas polymericola]TWT66238.1 Chitinase B precursor [Posidoniimonas polymericola]
MPVVLGYYPAYEGFNEASIPWDRFTHVCHAFITSDKQGQIETNDKVPSRSLTERAARHDTPVILSVGGWGDADGFEMATSSPEKMASWVEDLTQIVVEYGYAGVDVDWEFPKDESTKQRFTQLVRAIRSSFDRVTTTTGMRLLITSAVTARPAEGKWIDGPALEGAIDFLNVMTYDFSGPFTAVASHHTPLFGSPEDPESAWRSTQAAMAYWEETQGFPRSKLNVGIPLYGRKFPLRQPYTATSGARAAGFGTPTYRQILKLIDAGWTLKQDAHAKAPWILAPQGELGIVAFDDEASARRKAEWARSQGYRGIFFWAIGHDSLPEGRFPLLDASIAGWQGAE